MTIKMKERKFNPLLWNQDKPVHEYMRRIGLEWEQDENNRHRFHLKGFRQVELMVDKVSYYGNSIEPSDYKITLCRYDRTLDKRDQSMRLDKVIAKPQDFIAKVNRFTAELEALDLERKAKQDAKELRMEEAVKALINAQWINEEMAKDGAEVRHFVSDFMFKYKGCEMVFAVSSGLPIIKRVMFKEFNNTTRALVHAAWMTLEDM